MVLCVFNAKNYLWPENRDQEGGLINPPWDEDVKCKGGVEI